MVAAKSSCCYGKNASHSGTFFSGVEIAPKTTLERSEVEEPEGHAQRQISLKKATKDGKNRSVL